MEITANWPDLLDRSFTEIYDQVYNDFPEQFSKVYTLDSSDRNYEKFSSATGFGMAQDTNESEEIPMAGASQGFNTTFTHKKTALGFSVSTELLEDDDFKVIAKKPASLARSLRLKVEHDAADVFNNATTAAKYSGGDGKALIATDHSREDGTELPVYKAS